LPFLIGLLLTPVGAAIGTLLTIAFLNALSPHPLLAGELVGGIVFGLIPGLFLAAPVTIIALPISCIVLERRAALGVARLALAGAILGFIVVMAVLLTIWWRDAVDKSDREFWLLTVAIAANGGLAGAACGALLAAILRRLGRPQRAGTLDGPAV
jgi:hypothetical protein